MLFSITKLEREETTENNVKADRHQTECSQIEDC
jgi:hypothetical protein